MGLGKRGQNDAVDRAGDASANPTVEPVAGPAGDQVPGGHGPTECIGEKRPAEPRGPVVPVAPALGLADPLQQAFFCGPGAGGKPIVS